MSRTLLMVGTRKGMWLGTSDEARSSWEWTGPHFPMEEVYSVMIDTRGTAPRLLAGASSSWLGPQVWRSDDLGATWDETPNGAVRFPEDTGATLAFDPASIPLWLSILTWASAGLLYLRLDLVRTVLRRADMTLVWSFDKGFDAAMFGLIRLSAAVTRLWKASPARMAALAAASKPSTSAVGSASA